MKTALPALQPFKRKLHVSSIIWERTSSSLASFFLPQVSISQYGVGAPTPFSKARIRPSDFAQNLSSLVIILTRCFCGCFCWFPKSAVPRNQNYNYPPPLTLIYRESQICPKPKASSTEFYLEESASGKSF